MKCAKCENEVINDSKFCNNCGEKIDEKSLTYCVNDAIESTRRLWFIIGFLKGACSNDKEKEMYKNFMKSEIGGTPLQIFKDYERIIKYWRKFANLDVDNYVKEKEDARLKRIGVSKTKRMKNLR